MIFKEQFRLELNKKQIPLEYYGAKTLASSYNNYRRANKDEIKEKQKDTAKTLYMEAEIIFHFKGLCRRNFGQYWLSKLDTGYPCVTFTKKIDIFLLLSGKIFYCLHFSTNVFCNALKQKMCSLHKGGGGVMLRRTMYLHHMCFGSEYSLIMNEYIKISEKKKTSSVWFNVRKGKNH